MNQASAARVLGCPRDVIAAKVKRGQLRVYRDSHGQPWLSRREVESLRARAFASLAKQRRI